MPDDKQPDQPPLPEEATPLEKRAFEYGFSVGRNMVGHYPHEQHSDPTVVAYGLVGAFWGLIVREQLPFPKTAEEGREQIGVVTAFAAGFEFAYNTAHGQPTEGADQAPPTDGSSPPPPKDDGVPMFG